jgi:DMSO/TMAO reductase YedYZ molybdopterin-dependent catalytic subunit
VSGGSTSLPPGQTAIEFFPRFGVPAYADRWPKIPERPALAIAGQVETPFELPLSALSTLPRREVLADFHCVTTWTRQGLRWSGFLLSDVLDTLIVPKARPRQMARYIQFISLDGYKCCIDRRDVDAGALLADHLDGEPLPLEHGEPLRLVAPALYGYKSAKHICGIDFLADYARSRAERQTLAHPRGRVAHEERGRFLPGWVYRHIYRAFIARTLAHYERAAERRHQTWRAPS